MSLKSWLSASTYLALAWVLSVSSLGCFDHPDDKVDQMVCTTDNNCPNGY